MNCKYGLYDPKLHEREIKFRYEALKKLTAGLMNASSENREHSSSNPEWARRLRLSDNMIFESSASGDQKKIHRA